MVGAAQQFAKLVVRNATKGSKSTNPNLEHPKKGSLESCLALEGESVPRSQHVTLHFVSISQQSSRQTAWETEQGISNEEEDAEDDSAIADLDLEDDSELSNCSFG